MLEEMIKLVLEFYKQTGCRNSLKLGLIGNRIIERENLFYNKLMNVEKAREKVFNNRKLETKTELLKNILDLMYIQIGTFLEETNGDVQKTIEKIKESNYKSLRLEELLSEFGTFMLNELNEKLEKENEKTVDSNFFEEKERFEKIIKKCFIEIHNQNMDLTFKRELKLKEILKEQEDLLYTEALEEFSHFKNKIDLEDEIQ